MLCQCLHGQLNISFLFLKKIYLVVGLCCSTSALSLQLAGFSIVVELSCPVVCGILVPGPGVKATSLMLEGEFLITGPPRKSLNISYF